jgi:hypothetical protein
MQTVCEFVGVNSYKAWLNAVNCFVHIFRCITAKLWEKFCEFEANEEKKHEFGYWWESQVLLARRAMEREGAKILEFEDEEVDMEDKKGRPVVF